MNRSIQTISDRHGQLFPWKGGVLCTAWDEGKCLRVHRSFPSTGAWHDVSVYDFRRAIDFFSWHHRNLALCEFTRYPRVPEFQFVWGIKINCRADMEHPRLRIPYIEEIPIRVLSAPFTEGLPLPSTERFELPLMYAKVHCLSEVRNDLRPEARESALYNDIAAFLMLENSLDEHGDIRFNRREPIGNIIVWRTDLKCLEHIQIGAMHGFLRICVGGRPLGDPNDPFRSVATIHCPAKKYYEANTRGGFLRYWQDHVAELREVGYPVGRTPWD